MLNLKGLTATLLVCLANCEIFHLEVEKGHRSVIDLGAFGFLGTKPDGTPQSNFTIIISEFTVYDPYGNRTERVNFPVGFSLEGRDTINNARLEQNVQYDNSSCFVTWSGRNDRMLILYPYSSNDKQYPFVAAVQETITRVPKPESPIVFDWSKKNLTAGFLALFFFNCNEKYSSSFKVKVIEYNVDSNGSPNYLSIGRSHLPVLISVFCFVYFLLLGVWSWLCFNRRQWVYKIHILMGVLVFFKSLSLLFESIQLHVIKIYGHHTLSSDVPYYTVLTLKGCILFSVILLIGTGWSFVKPYLGEKDKRILMIVLPLQLMVNIAEIIVETLNEGNKQWIAWRDLLRVFDIICCCAILMPIVWSIRSLREASSADGKVRKNLMRLKQFRSFYILVVSYIYFTRIIVVLVQTALHYKVTWVGPFLLEFGTLIFYSIVGWRFRPMNDNPYIPKNEEDDGFDDVALRKELEEQSGIL